MAASRDTDKTKTKESPEKSLIKEGIGELEGYERASDIKRSEASPLNLAAGAKRKLHEEGDSSSKPKISINFAGSAKKASPVSMSFSKQGTDKKIKDKQAEPLTKKKPGAVAAVFAAEGSDEEEEMPREAKMRMRNLGKDTPTSAGPNSFNKGRKGFTDHLKVWEKSMKLEKPTANKISDKT